MTVNTDPSEAPSPGELRALMQALGLHDAALGRLVGVDRGAPGRWLSGKVPVPFWLVAHLRIVQELRAICAEVAAAAVDPLPERLQHHRSSIDLSQRGNESGQTITTGEQTASNMEPMEEASNMTNSEFVAALQSIGWKQSDFARQTGCDVKTASRYATGKTPIPRWVVRHLDLLRQLQRLQQFLQPVKVRKAPGCALK